ncbi:hypothetical protein AAFC00_007119 [Neodothiora populina]|uniref:Carboxylic ester hydrolase n=1 Tax=Neodothiora populina TaxID=2781224 RepID=A0ABR3PC86_9PEZI
MWRPLTFLLWAIVTVCQAAPGKGRHGDWDKGLVVYTSSGEAHGKIDSAYPHVRQFLGIPFAQPPVGSLRWMPPQPLPPSAARTKIEATNLPPSCIQYLGTGPSLYLDDVLEFNLEGLNRTGIISEDCLTLSVWAPTGNDCGPGLPVLLYIYGGGFETGGQNVPYQLPSQWVERSRDHIVVSFNYRLNIFGFPNAAGLDDKNVGLLDQRLAVEWVSANIARFGGDPSRITLWGQSAGGASVDLYNYAWSDDPIVSSLIMDSGNTFLLSSNDFTQSNFSFVASSLGCGGVNATAELACMRGLNASTIENFLSVYQQNGSLPAISFAPIADEKVVFSNYTLRASQGHISKIPAIMGTNAQDGVPFAPYNAAGVNQTLAQAAYLALFFCTTTEAIELRQLAGVPTYTYLYSGNFSNISPRPWMGAYHSSELPLIFGTYGNYRGPSTALEVDTSKAMQDAWLTFAADGPEGLNGIGWEEYVLGASSVRDFGNGVAVKTTSLAATEALCAA